MDKRISLMRDQRPALIIFYHALLHKDNDMYKYEMGSHENNKSNCIW